MMSPAFLTFLTPSSHMLLLFDNKEEPRLKVSFFRYVNPDLNVDQKESIILTFELIFKGLLTPLRVINFLTPPPLKDPDVVYGWPLPSVPQYACPYVN